MVLTHMNRASKNVFQFMASMTSEGTLFHIGQSIMLIIDLVLHWPFNHIYLVKIMAKW